VLVGLPVRGRTGDWYRTRDVDAELGLLLGLGGGGACGGCECATGEWDDRGVGGKAVCCRCIKAASMSTEEVPAALDAALRFESWWEMESDDNGPYRNVLTRTLCNAMICAWSWVCDSTDDAH
jgi:hypothetical protein